MGRSLIKYLTYSIGLIWVGYEFAIVSVVWNTIIVIIIITLVPWQRKHETIKSSKRGQICNAMASAALLTLDFTAINDHRQRKSSQPVIQNKENVESCSETKIAISLKVHFRNSLSEQERVFIERKRIHANICIWHFFCLFQKPIGRRPNSRIFCVINEFTAQPLSLLHLEEKQKVQFRCLYIES